MIPSESPLDRLNYYNGQRLESSDLRLEQEYHMRVRRWLNKSLYTWGIAAGLEVNVKKTDDGKEAKHTVVVSPGLALDQQGREIILLEPRIIQVVGTPTKDKGIVLGNYLTIQYNEAPVAVIEDGCTIPLNEKKNNNLAWKGPKRMRAEPKISWQNSWPNNNSNKIVLAQVALDETCSLQSIRPWVRRYVGAAQSPKSLAYALEGEKDITKENPKKIYFHIRGGRPNAVTLYLKGDRFSTIYYTELGKHNHVMNLTIQDLTIPAHDHRLGELTTSPEVEKIQHNVFALVEHNPPELRAINVVDMDDLGERETSDVKRLLKMDISHDPPNHYHVIESGGATEEKEEESLEITVARSSLDDAGASPPGVHLNDNPYTYINNLEIWLNEKPYTPEIISRLGWDSLGNGNREHELNEKGTGPIQLDLLADLNEGLNILELKVGSSGGKIHYNLYVE